MLDLIIAVNFVINMIKLVNLKVHLSIVFKNVVMAQYTMLGTLEKNGMAKRWNHTLIDMVRIMTSKTNLLERLYGNVSIFLIYSNGSKTIFE